MRIIAGKYRGRTLAAFQGEAIRPTPDRVKESLFQILAPRIRGARVLDLFCGSGALGAECLSRGAAEVCFNDVSKESLSVLGKNLKALGETCKVTCRDFRACLLSAEGKFDLVFSDPPYREDYLGEICSLLASRGLMAEGGLLLHESEREETVPAGWTFYDVRRYGRTKIYFLQRCEA